jgi:hypothetical protein
MRGVYERPCRVCGYEGSKLGVDDECVGSFVEGCVDPGGSLGYVGVVDVGVVQLIACLTWARWTDGWAGWLGAEAVI